MKRPAWLLFWGYILAFSVGNLYKISLFFPEVRINLLDILVGLTLVYALLFKNSAVISQIKSLQKFFLPAGIFLLIGLIGLLWSLNRYTPIQVLVGGLYWLRLLGYISLPAILPLLFSDRDLHKLRNYLLFPLALTGLGQYLFFPDVRSLQLSDWDPHYFRVVGTLLDPGFTSILLCFSLFYLWLKPGFIQTRLHQVIIVLIYVVFALTYSRSGYLAFLAGCAYLAKISKSPRKFIYPLILIAVTVLLLPRAPGGEGVKLERTSSIKARILNWTNSANIFLRYPLTGVGFNTYRYAQRHAGYLDNADWLKSHAGAGADSSLLFVAATTGIFGLAAYLYWLKQVWLASVGNLSLRVGLIALAVHSFFLNSLFYPFVLFWVFVHLPVKSKSLRVN
jgi:hypothetical protein